MLKRILWNLSIIIISLFLLLVGFFQSIDHFPFFKTEQMKKYTLDHQSISFVMDDIFKNIDSIFNTVYTLIISPYIKEDDLLNSFKTVLAKNPIVSYITIVDGTSKKVLFTNNNHYASIALLPCIKEFQQETTDKDSNILCQSINGLNIYINLSKEGIFNQIHTYLKTLPYYQLESLPLKNLYLSGHTILINFPQKITPLETNIFKDSLKLLEKGTPFKLVFKGDDIFVSQLKTVPYNLYYNPLKSLRSLSIKEIILISFCILMSFIILILGIQYKGKKKNTPLNENIEEFKDEEENTIITADKDITEILEVKTKTKTEISFPKRDLSELRNLIDQVNNPNISKTIDTKELEGITHNNIEDLLKDSHNHPLIVQWRHLIEKYEGLSYIIETNKANNSIFLKGFNKTFLNFEHEIPLEKFYIPALFNNKEENHFYIYTDAGKTSLVKALFNNSIIDARTMEGALFVRLSSPYHYIICLFPKFIEHNIYNNLFTDLIKQNQVIY